MQWIFPPGDFLELQNPKSCAWSAGARRARVAATKKRYGSSGDIREGDCDKAPSFSRCVLRASHSPPLAPSAPCRGAALLALRAHSLRIDTISYSLGRPPPDRRGASATIPTRPTTVGDREAANGNRQRPRLLPPHPGRQLALEGGENPPCPRGGHASGRRGPGGAERAKPPSSTSVLPRADTEPRGPEWPSTATTPTASPRSRPGSAKTIDA